MDFYAWSVICDIYPSYGSVTSVLQLQVENNGDEHLDFDIGNFIWQVKDQSVTLTLEK